MSDFFGSIKRGVKEYARSSRTSDGRSTLHIAALTNVGSPIQSLLDAGVDRTTQDLSGNTALHVAAEEGAEISLQTLLTYKPRMLSPTGPVPAVANQAAVSDIVDLKNKRGETPLHLACRANSLSCTQLLLEHASDMYAMTGEGKQAVHYAVKNDSIACVMLLFERDSRLAHTDSNNEPLIHLANSKEMVDLLLKHGIDASARDSGGNTVIHAAIKQKNFQLLMALLLSSVSVNLRDSVGNTALHTAVFENVENIYCKTLVVFGIDLEARNHANKTAYQVAEELGREEFVRILQEVGGHDPKFLARGQRTSKSKPRDKDDGPRVRKGWNDKDAAVLCIDGGGIKGVVATQILLEIEKYTQTSTIDLFDWISGSSIGSLVVLAISHSSLTMQDMHRIFFDLKNKIFQGSRPYKSEVFEECIVNITGDTMMNDWPYPRVVVTTTIGDVRPCELHLYTNYTPHDELAWKAGRASGAAPTYFAPFENRYLDGGVMSNNPTLNTLVEMRKYYKKTKPTSRDPCQPKIVVSVGTGLTPTEDVENINVGFRPRNIMDAARFASGAVEMFSTLVEQCTNCDGPHVEQSKYWCESVDSAYYRLQPALEYQTALDEKNDLNIILMCWETCQYLYEERETIAELSATLYGATASPGLLTNITGAIMRNSDSGSGEESNFLRNLTGGVLG